MILAKNPSLDTPPTYYLLRFSYLIENHNYAYCAGFALLDPSHSKWKEKKKSQPKNFTPLFLIDGLFSFFRIGEVMCLGVAAGAYILTLFAVCLFSK